MNNDREWLGGQQSALLPIGMPPDPCHPPPSWRRDPAGKRHLFDPGHEWSRCRLVCRSLTAPFGDDALISPPCPACQQPRPRPSAPPADIDATIDALCELQRQRTIEHAVAIGRVIVEGIYGGDMHRLHDRPRDCPSLRALAAHPRMPFSTTALHQAIGVYRLVGRCPGVLDTDLTLTHLRAVLPCPEAAQDQLLSRAVAEAWPSRRLVEEARALHPPRSKGGRPRLPRVVKTLNQIDHVADQPLAWTDLEQLDRLPADKRSALSAKVVRLERRLRGLRLRLEDASSEPAPPLLPHEGPP